MASSGINVLRWSALGAGIFYGVYHQAGIKAQLKVRHIDNEYEKQQSLIQKAKAEWAKKTMPKEKTDPSAVITDPSDPKFDFEAYLTLKQNEI